MFSTRKRCLIGIPIRGYQYFCSLPPKNWISGPKTAKFGPKLAFLAKYWHFFPFDLLPDRKTRGAPQDSDPSPQAQTVTDASGSGTPASERSQVKVAGVHWFSCTPSAIAKAWIRTLIVLILTVGLIVLLFIFMNQAGLIRLK